jgi:hypothetical protein
MKDVSFFLKKMYDQKVSNLTNTYWIVKILLLIDFISIVACMDEHVFTAQDSHSAIKYIYYLNIVSLIRMLFIHPQNKIGDVVGECSTYMTGGLIKNIMIGMILFIFLSFLFLLFTTKKSNLIFISIVNLNNFLIRHFPHLTWYLINVQFLNSEFNSQGGYVFLLVLLNCLLLTYSLFYCYYIWSDDVGFTYNYENAKFDIFAVLLKWIMSIIYVLHISKKCQILTSTSNINSEYLLPFVKSIFVFLTVVKLFYFFYYQKEIYFSNVYINYFRFAMQVFLLYFMAFEFIQDFFALNPDLYDLTVFIVILALAIISVKILHDNLNSLVFKNSKNLPTLYIYLTDQYIFFLKKQKKGSAEHLENLYEAIFAHYLQSNCSEEEVLSSDDLCLICSNKPQDFNINNVETLLYNIFTDIIKSEKLKKNRFYYNLIRIRCLYIVSYKKGNDNVIFLEILKCLSKPQSSSTRVFLEYLYTTMIKSRDESSAFLASQMNFNKLIVYIEACEELAFVCSEVKKTIELVKNRVRFEEIMKMAEQIFELRKNIIDKSEHIKEKDNLLLVNFYYNQIFNEVLKDNSNLQKFYDNINIIEENLYKMYILLIECDMKEKNLILKNLTFDFLEKLKTREKNLKNEIFSKLFPYDIRHIQTRKIFSIIEEDYRENFQLKLILQDYEKYISYYFIHFKMIVSLDQKVHLMISLRNMPSTDDTTNNYLLICDEGNILGISDGFKEHFYFADDVDITKKNLFEYVCIPKAEFFGKLRSIDENVKDFEDSGRSTVRQLNFRMDELFRLEHLENAIKNYNIEADYDEMVNIICDENIFQDGRCVFLLNMKKTKKKEDSNFDKTFHFADEEKKEISLKLPNDNFSSMSQTLHYSTTSNKSNYIRKENLAPAIAGNDELFRKTIDKKSNENILCAAYLFDLFIFVGSMAHLVILYLTLNNFQDTNNGLYYLRTVHSQYTIVTMNSAKEIILDDYEIKFEEGSVLKDRETRLLLNNYEYELIGTRLQDLKTFTNENQNNKEIQDLFLNTYINYVYPSELSGTLEINSKIFIDLLDLLTIHLNKVKSIIDLPLPNDGLWRFNAQTDEIESLVFAYQNYFPVYEAYFEKIIKLFTENITRFISTLHLISYIYTIFYLSMHFVTYSFYMYLIYQYFLKHTMVLTFISNLDEDHLNFLNFKISNLRKAIDFVISPPIYLGKIQMYNLKNKEKQGQIQERERERERLTHSPLGSHSSLSHLVGKKVHLTPLDNMQAHHLKVHFLEKYVKKITLFLFVFLSMLTLMFILFNRMIDTMYKTMDYTSNVVDIQLNLFSSFLLFQLSLISNMNLTKKIDTNLQTRDDYFEFFQNKSISILQNINSLMDADKLLKNEFDYNLTDMKGHALCEFIYAGNDTIFQKFSDPVATEESFLDRCKEDGDEYGGGHIIYTMIPYFMEYLRNEMNSLRMDPGIRNRITDNEMYRHYFELLLVYINGYFSRFRIKIVEPLVFTGFDNFFHNLIIILAGSLVVDLLCFLMIKILVVFTIKNSSEIFSKLLNVLKS